VSNELVSQPVPVSSTPQNLHVQVVLQKAQDELRQLISERVAVTRRIGSVKQTIVGLVKLCGDEVLPDELRAGVSFYTRGVGITDSCRRVLIEASQPLNSREVCEIVQKTAPGVLATHKDPVATVTTVLCRLAAYGEILAIAAEDGQRVWQWSAENEQKPVLWKSPQATE